MLVNTVYDLQNMKNYLSGTYALGRDIDASVTSSWNGGAGFAPVGTTTGGLHRTFDGQSQTISDLFINRPASQYVGLFGYLDSGSMVSNIGLLGGSVTGRTSVGALAGASFGAVMQSYATGAVAGTDVSVGGLVGDNYGSIAQSYATGAVTGAYYYAGGLVGSNAGYITQSYATGAVAAQIRQAGWSATTLGLSRNPRDRSGERHRRGWRAGRLKSVLCHRILRHGSGERHDLCRGAGRQQLQP